MSKWDFENAEVINCDFSTKSVPEQYGFLNNTVPWGPKNSTIQGPPVDVMESDLTYFEGKKIKHNFWT